MVTLPCKNAVDGVIFLSRQKGKKRILASFWNQSLLFSLLNGFERYKAIF